MQRTINKLPFCSASRTSQNGSSLVYVIMTMVVVSALGAGIVRMTSTSTFSELPYDSFQRAKHLAEFGYAYAPQIIGDPDSYNLILSDEERIEIHILERLTPSLLNIESIGIIQEGHAMIASRFVLQGQATLITSTTQWLNSLPDQAPQPRSGAVEGMNVSDATATELKPYAVDLSTGETALLFAELSEKGQSGSRPYEPVGQFRYGCVWSRETFSLGSAALNVCFQFQFFPGETSRTQDRNTADGFTMTLLPASFDVGNDIDGYVCGFSGSNLGFGGIDTPKMAVEFDIHRYSDQRDFTPNDPQEGNHVALLLSEDAGLPVAVPGRFYSVRHDFRLNPPCDPQTPDNSACVMMVDANKHNSAINLPAWMEWRNCNTAQHPGCEMPLVDPEVWRINNDVSWRTWPHHAAVIVHRNCNADCSQCGLSGGTRTYVSAQIRCLLGSEVPHPVDSLQGTDYCGQPRLLNACVDEPMNMGIFDEVRLGFTAATGGGRTGVLISHIDIDCDHISSAP